LHSNNLVMAARPIRMVVQALVLVLAAVVWIMTRSSALRTVQGEFQFNGRAIGEFHCVPPQPGRHPAVIMLHGATLPGADLDEFQAMCVKLSDRGYWGEFIEY